MSTPELFPETSALYRLRVTAEADLGALSRVLERFQNLNVVPQLALILATIIVLLRLDHFAAWCLVPLAVWGRLSLGLFCS